MKRTIDESSPQLPEKKAKCISAVQQEKDALISSLQSTCLTQFFPTGILGMIVAFLQSSPITGQRSSREIRLSAKCRCLDANGNVIAFSHMPDGTDFSIQDLHGNGTVLNHKSEYGCITSIVCDADDLTTIEGFKEMHRYKIRGNTLERCKEVFSSETAPGEYQMYRHR